MCGYEVTFAPFPPTVQKTTKINFQDYGPDKLINTTKDLYKTQLQNWIFELYSFLTSRCRRKNKICEVMSKLNSKVGMRRNFSLKIGVKVLKFTHFDRHFQKVITVKFTGPIFNISGL